MKRRSFVTALFCAPAIVRAESLMPIWVPKWSMSTGMSDIGSIFAQDLGRKTTDQYWIKHIGLKFGEAPLKQEGRFIFYDPYPQAPQNMVNPFTMGPDEVTLPPGWVFCDAQGNAL